MNVASWKQKRERERDVQQPQRDGAISESPLQHLSFLQSSSLITEIEEDPLPLLIMG
jgi:hypothetical protein